jgi:nickel/cobalt exporter
LAAVLAMSAGTALTTGALAAATVYARRLAQSWAGAERPATVLALRGAEFVAAALVLLIGLALLLGASSAQAA